MFVIVLGIGMSVLDTSIVNLALPGIARDLQASAAQSVWVVNAYQVATLGLLLPCAMLGDLVGYRRVYLSGLALFTGASLGCVMADSLPMLAGWRARGVTIRLHVGRCLQAGTGSGCAEGHHGGDKNRVMAVGSRPKSASQGWFGRVDGAGKRVARTSCPVTGCR